jgi:hypothetical protein
VGGSPRHALGRLSVLLRELFPQREPAEREPAGSGPARWFGSRYLIAVAYALSLVAGTVLLLARSVGTPPWRSIYAEDFPVYLAEALAHPWHSVLASYAGYLQLVPRLIGQLASLLPIRHAAAVFAISGALVAAACALFVFHASSGHVRSLVLRALLGLSVLLLPVALLQIANSGVNTPWYLEMALFWALLWRPPSRAGAVLAAVVGFAAASSNVTAVLFAIIVLARIIALPRVREQAVSIGWALGCLMQLPYFLRSGSTSGTRMSLSQLATPGQSVSFYGHDVVLPAFGWHFSWLLRHWWDRNYALILIGGVLAIIVVCVLIAGTPRVRLFTVTALGFGFVFAMFAATVTWWVTVNGVTPVQEPGARYTCLPIVLITAVLIVAVDALFVSGGRLRSGHRPVTAVIATVGLIAVLCVGWIPDFRYVAPRTQVQPWAPIANQWLRTCQHQDAVRYKDSYDKFAILIIPCSRIRP